MRLSRATAASIATFCVIVIGSIDLSQFGASPIANLMAKAAAAATASALAILFLISDRTSLIFGRNATSLFIAIFGFVALLSVTWSGDVGATITALMAWLVTFFAAYLLLGLSPDRMAKSLVYPFGVIAVLSLIYAVISPNAFAITEGLVRLRGVVYGPHGLAEPCVLCLCILFSGVPRLHRFTWVAFLVAFGACLYLTYSRQAYVALAAGAGIAIYLRARGDMRIGLIIAATVFTFTCVIAALLLMPSAGGIASVVSRGGGDDVGTLTGRTLIWAAAIALIHAKPLLGYGFGAGGNAIAGGYSGGLSGWTTESAHNAVLQVGLDLGLVGIFLLTLCIIRFVVNAFRIERQFSIPLLIAVLTMSFVERGLYETGGFLPLVFLLILNSRSIVK